MEEGKSTRESNSSSSCYRRTITRIKTGRFETALVILGLVLVYFAVKYGRSYFHTPQVVSILHVNQDIGAHHAEGQTKVKNTNGDLRAMNKAIKVAEQDDEEDTTASMTSTTEDYTSMPASSTTEVPLDDSYEEEVVAVKTSSRIGSKITQALQSMVRYDPKNGVGNGDNQRAQDSSSNDREIGLNKNTVSSKNNKELRAQDTSSSGLEKNTNKIQTMTNKGCRTYLRVI